MCIDYNQLCNIFKSGEKLYNCLEELNHIKFVFKISGLQRKNDFDFNT